MMVGFFSSTKLFDVKRLMVKMIKGGRRVSLYRRSLPAVSCVVRPLNLASTVEIGTCGMMLFLSVESWNTGMGGRSMARKRKGDRASLISVKASCSERSAHDTRLALITSSKIKLWAFVCFGRFHHNCLILYTEFTLKS